MRKVDEIRFLRFSDGLRIHATARFLDHLCSDADESGLPLPTFGLEEVFRDRKFEYRPTTWTIQFNRAIVIGDAGEQGERFPFKLAENDIGQIETQGMRPRFARVVYIAMPVNRDDPGGIMLIKTYPFAPGY